MVPAAGIREVEVEAMKMLFAPFAGTS